MTFVTDDMERLRENWILRLSLIPGRVFPFVVRGWEAGLVIPDHLSLVTGINIMDQAAKWIWS